MGERKRISEELNDSEVDYIDIHNKLRKGNLADTFPMILHKHNVYLYLAQHHLQI